MLWLCNVIIGLLRMSVNSYPLCIDA